MSHCSCCPAPNPKFESRESHFELIFTGSNFHHSTTPAGHLIAKLDRIWGVLDPTCGSHMTGLGGARTASDDQGRLGGSGGLRKRCKLPSHGPSSQAPILPNIGPQLLPTDIFPFDPISLRSKLPFESHQNVLVWEYWSNCCQTYLTYFGLHVL